MGAEIRFLKLMTIQELREEYTTLYGKKPFAGWKEDKLKERIAEKESTPVKSTEPVEPTNPVEPVKTDHATAVEAIEYFRKNPGEKPPVAFINGEPKAIVGNQYIDYKNVEYFYHRGLELYHQDQANKSKNV